MPKGGDALEVKKTETLSTELQLNSSHPKAKLFSNSTLINNVPFNLIMPFCLAIMLKI